MFNLRHAMVWLHDLLVAGAAYGLALYVRLGADFSSIPLHEGLLAFSLYLLICGAVFFYFGLYRGVWRYTSLHDLTQIVRAVIFSTVLFVGAAFLLTRAEALPRSLPLMLLFVLPCMLSASRVGYRLLREQRLFRLLDINAKPILLIGAGDEAETFIRTASRDPKAAWSVVGVIDEKGTRVGRMIHNVAIMGTIPDITKAVATLKRDGKAPARLILTKAPTAYTSAQLRQLMELSNALDLPLGRLPSLTELRASLEASTGLIRPVAVEDLLGRPETHLQHEEIAALVKGRRVLVTGSGGTIGGELTRQIAALAPQRLVLLDNGEFNLYTIDHEIRTQHPQVQVHTLLADVRDRARLESIFATEQPEIVFHAAALKHVPLSEANVRETVLTNVQGTKNVADCAQQVRARAMVMISTDKAINPTNVMGATKRIAESYCQSLDLGQSATRFMTVRFGNVLGSSGSVVPLFQKQLAMGGPLTVTHPDITRYFMTVREAVQLVLQASAYGMASQSERGKIFVLDMGQPVKIIDLARQMIRLAGLRPDEDIKIAITGLRPGEKLYEELFSHEEPPVAAGVDGVLVAAPRTADTAQLTQGIKALLDHAAGLAADPVLSTTIAALVPEYQPAQPSAAA